MYTLGYELIQTLNEIYDISLATRYSTEVLINLLLDKTNTLLHYASYSGTNYRQIIQSKVKNTYTVPRNTIQFDETIKDNSGYLYNINEKDIPIKIEYLCLKRNITEAFKYLKESDEFKHYALSDNYNLKDSDEPIIQPDVAYKEYKSLEVTLKTKAYEKFFIVKKQGYAKIYNNSGSGIGYKTTYLIVSNLECEAGITRLEKYLPILLGLDIDQIKKDKPKVFEILQKTFTGTVAPMDYLSLIPKDYNKINKLLNRGVIQDSLKIFLEGNNINIVNKITNSKNTVSRLTESITIELKNLKALQIQLEMSKLNVNNIEETLKETETILKANNKYFKDFYVERNNIYIKVVAPLINFEEDLIKLVRPKEPKLVKALFEKQNIQINCYTQFKINLENCTVNIEGYRIDDVRNIYFPHPHLHGFNCFGGNKTNIIKAITNKDFPSLLIHLLYTAKQLNLADGTVTTYLFKTIKNEKLKPSFEVVDTGEMISYYELTQRKELYN